MRTSGEKMSFMTSAPLIVGRFLKLISPEWTIRRPLGETMWMLAAPLIWPAGQNRIFQPGQGENHSGSRTRLNLFKFKALSISVAEKYVSTFSPRYNFLRVTQ